MSELYKIGPIALSFCALCISLYSYFRMSGIAYRQYLLALNKPLVDWASDVAAVNGEVTRIAAISDISVRRTAFVECTAKISILMAKGSIVTAYRSPRTLSNKNFSLLGITEKIANLLLDHAAKVGEKLDLMPYAKLIEDFCQLVIDEIRTSAGALR